MQYWVKTQCFPDYFLHLFLLIFFIYFNILFILMLLNSSFFPFLNLRPKTTEEDVLSNNELVTVICLCQRKIPMETVIMITWNYI